MSKGSFYGVAVVFHPDLKRGYMYGELSYSPKMHDENRFATIRSKVRKGLYLLSNGWYCTNEMFTLIHGEDRK